VGLQFSPRRKTRLKWVRLLNPHEKQISVMVLSVSTSSRLASAARLDWT